MLTIVSTMLLQSLAIFSIGLLLFFPTNTVCRQCGMAALDQDSIVYFKRITCKYKNAVKANWGYETNVEINFIVSRPMDGWQISLQFKRNVTIGDVTGGQQTSTPPGATVIFHNRVQRLQTGNSSKLQFKVYTLTKDVKLFPVLFDLQLPPARKVQEEMCRGSDIDSPNLRFHPDETDKSKFRLELIFKARVLIPWLTCTLTFMVPVSIASLHHAEFVTRNAMDTEFVIAKSSNMPKTTVIEYKILKKRVKNDGYNTSHCRACTRDPTTCHCATDPVDNRPLILNPTTVTTQVTHTTMPATQVAPETHASRSANTTAMVPVNTPSIFWVSTDNVVTQKSNKATRIATEISQVPPDPNSKDDRSSNSHVIWIAVAAGCAGALIVLLVVIAFMIMSRKSGNKETTLSQSLALNPVQTSNEYEGSAISLVANGNGFADTSCCRDFSHTTNSPTKLGSDYEELDGFRPYLGSAANSSKFDYTTEEKIAMSSYPHLLPGQRLQMLMEEQERTTYRKGARGFEDEKRKSGLYVAMHGVDKIDSENRPFDDCESKYKYGTDREDTENETMMSEKTYVTMLSVDKEDSKHKNITKLTSTTESVGDAVESESPTQDQTTEAANKDTELTLITKSVSDAVESEHPIQEQTTEAANKNTEMSSANNPADDDTTTEQICLDIDIDVKNDDASPKLTTTDN